MSARDRKPLLPAINHLAESVYDGLAMRAEAGSATRDELRLDGLDEQSLVDRDRILSVDTYRGKQEIAHLQEHPE